jgi:hypothetical protein
MALDIEDAQTQEALNNFRRDVSLYHNDPAAGVLRKQGKEALGLYREAEGWMNKKTQEYLGKMKSPRMKESFQKMAEGAILTQGEHNSQFEAAEAKKYREAEAGAAIEMALSDAARNWNDEKAAEEARRRAEMALELKLRGLGMEAWKNGLLELHSAFARTRLAGMLRDSPMKAEEWYRENKKDFTGRDQAEAEKLLETETRAYKLEAARDGLISRHGMNQAAALKEISEKYEGDKEKEVRALYNAWRSDQERIREENERKRFDSLRDAVADSKSAADAQKIIFRSGLKGYKRRQLEGLAEQVHRPAEFHEDVRDYLQAYGEIKAGKIKTQEELVARWYGILSPGSVKSLNNVVYAVQGRGEEERRKGPDFPGYSDGGAVSARVERLKKGRLIRTPAEEALFISLVGYEKQNAEEEKKRRLTPLEMGALLDSVSKYAVTQSGLRIPQALDAYYRAQGYAPIEGVDYVRKGPGGGMEVQDPLRPQLFSFDWAAWRKAREELESKNKARGGAAPEAWDEIAPSGGLW